MSENQIETGEVADVLAVPMNAPLDELLKAQEHLTAKIANLQRAARADDLATARELVRRHGFTAAELRCPSATAAAAEPQESSESARRPVAPKYRNPETGDTWTGRGLKPKWVEASLAAGKSLGELLIPASGAESQTGTEAA